MFGPQKLAEAYVSVFLQGYRPIVVRVMHVEQNWEQRQNTDHQFNQEPRVRRRLCWACDHVICLRHTSQFLLPDTLTLIVCHVQRRRPEMGHDHQELLEANLLNLPLAILMKVSSEEKKKGISYIIFHSMLLLFKNYSDCTFGQRRPLWSASGWDCMTDLGSRWSDLSWRVKRGILKEWHSVCTITYNCKLSAICADVKPVQQVLSSKENYWR